MIRPRIAALSLVLLAPLVAGCHSGMDAATGQQGATGNGIEVSTDGMQIDNATIVAGDEGSQKAAFLGTLYNPTDTPDELIAIGAADGQAKLLPNPIPLPARQAVSVQTGTDAEAQFSGVELAAGTYVPVTMVFRSAGQAEFSALVVPPYGFYSDAAPAGTSPRPQRTNEPVHTEE